MSKDRICKNCDNVFFVDKPSTKKIFCSRACRSAHDIKINKIRKERICKNCYKEFTVDKPSMKNVFCSRACRSAYDVKINKIKREKIISEIEKYIEDNPIKGCGEIKKSSHHFGISRSTLRRLGIRSKTTKKRLSAPNNLTDFQEEIFIGNILGDGSIAHIKENTGNNAYFSLTQKIANYEYVNSLISFYEPFSIGYYEKFNLRPININNKIIKHNSERLPYCGFYTMSHPVFTKYRFKWYKEPYLKCSPKIIPPDLKLTWRTMAFWMCDDGCNHHIYPEKYSWINLHTECFNVLQVEFLRDCLKNQLNVDSSINYGRNKQPIIRVPSKCYFYFIENIKQFIPWQCLKYKINEKV